MKQKHGFPEYITTLNMPTLSTLNISNQQWYLNIVIISDVNLIFHLYSTLKQTNLEKICHLVAGLFCSYLSRYLA